MSPDPNVQLRMATTADGAFIVEMARHACVIEDRPLPAADSEEVLGLMPVVGGRAIVAVDTGAVMLGAVWTFFHNPPLMIDANGAALPEICIAVVPQMHGRGVGTSLLTELVVQCTGAYEALTLNVHQRNPAAHLYKRAGFHVTGQGRGALGIAIRRDLV